MAIYSAKILINFDDTITRKTMLFGGFRASQHKAIHCYILLSIWILLIIVGVYIFSEPKKRLIEIEARSTEVFNSFSVDVKTKRILKICNFPEDIQAEEEGLLKSSKWLLKGLLILIRHGDRGPLQHVKKVSSINCGVENSELLSSYRAYLHNQTISGKVSWASPGPFHGFPFLPTHHTQCQLGQLTMQGIVQLLRMGDILKTSYSNIWPKLQNLSPYEIAVYSTRYRRTFQSVLALLYGLISHETLSKITIQESQSMSFCFRDCGCPVTEKLWKNVKKTISNQLHSHPAIASLSEIMSKYLFSSGAEQGAFASDPYSVKDALLSFVCHRNGLPCESVSNCIKRQNVVGIFTYTEWVSHQKWRNMFWKQYCSLKSYGLIRNIVQQMLHMVSNYGPYLVVYSGHDHTVEQLSSALGLKSDPFLLRYASRLVFEVYEENDQTSDAKGIYFRLLANGKDVTRQISFCKNIVSPDLRINLCRIENIVRFLHDDYFVSLNVTNYKDACVQKHD